MIDPAVIDTLVASLTGPSRADPPGQFPSDPVAAARPGLYSWWVDEEAHEVISLQLRTEIGSLIYAGQAGATRQPSGTPSKATLRSRIKQNHINGNAYSSTFRLTLSAVLLEPLGLLVMKPSRLTPESRAHVSGWIKRHLRVAVIPYDDRDELAEVEHAVLAVLDPPLNLDGRPFTPARTRLRDLRRRVTHPEQPVYTSVE